MPKKRLKKPFYRLTAECGSRECRHREFAVDRKSVHRVGTDGQAHETRNVVCPVCRMWADVKKIERVE